MAAANSSLSIEFECVVCSEQLDQPKYIGPCNHTFCKDCIHKYWISLGWRRTIPCPECRQECPIPRNGADDLKDNFKLSNIIETYRNQQQRTAVLTDIKCIRCPNRASSFCKECDLKLCPGCKGQHDRNAGTSEHHFFELCPTHGNGLLFFCSPCKQAVCSGCRISDHDQGDHHVVPICPIVGDLMSSIQASSAELEDALRNQVKEEETELLHLRDVVQQKTTSAEVLATASAERTIDAKSEEIKSLKAECQCIQKQIDLLVNKKEKLDDRTNQLWKAVDQLENEKTNIIADVKGRFAKPSDKVNQRLRSLDTRRKGMRTMLEQGRAVGFAKITIDTESIGKLTSIRQELIDLVNASKESDTRIVIEEVTSSISELGLDIVDMGQGQAGGQVVTSGDHPIRTGKTKRVFRELKKVCNVSFSKDRLREELHRLKYLHQDSRIATLRRSQGRLNGADTIHFHDEVFSALTGTITYGVYPATDLAVSSTGQVVVTRRERPPVRVFNAATGTYRDISITHDGEVIGDLRHIETDELDNMFVLTPYSNPLLLLVKPNGNVIQSVQLRGYAYNMAFCSLNRILYIATSYRILRFHWSNNILNEMSSSSHGVAGFSCIDVCIGSGGEVLVAGLMGNDIAIYQVEEGEDAEELVWRKIEYQDDVKKTRDALPCICINDDNLWLGYGDEFEKFRLV